MSTLSLPVSPPQWVEVLVVLSTADFIWRSIVLIKSLAVVSESGAGRIRPDAMPSTLMGRIITPVHGLVTFIPPLVYVVTLVFSGFQQPEWLARFTLSAELRDSTWGNSTRVTACLASLALRHLLENTFRHLGDQWHTIGRRERPRVVKTGPYAWVRHPGYSSVLLQEALCSIMFWSYIPLVALGITAFAFAIKMPIEEDLIMKDDGIKNEYLQYMKEVPARILPSVW